MSTSVPPARPRLPLWFKLLRQCSGTVIVAIASTMTAFAQSTAATPAPSARGTVASQELWLAAPDDACAAYLDTFANRRWIIHTASPADFVGEMAAFGFSSPVCRLLENPALWHATDEPDRFEVDPPLALLRALTAPERGALYRVLAHWQANKPERWPLVFADAATWDRLAAADLPPALLQRAHDLSYRFAGGWALSDFSVLAAEFPDRPVLLRFLQAASGVRTVLPRLSVRTATSVAETLAYWTANHHNPFSEPLLVALLEARTERGIDLASLLPGNVRELSYDLDPAEVSHDHAVNSMVIAADLAAPPHPAANLLEFLQWFNQRFQPTTEPPRFGDVLVLQQPIDPVLDYACAFVVDDLVFAKDPVGLGLWRFMRLNELPGRNPHFAGGTFLRVRYAPPSAAIP